MDNLKFSITELEAIFLIVKTVANNCNNYWESEQDIDYDKKEYSNYVDLINEIKYDLNMTNEKIDTNNIVKVLFKFRQI
jgi:dimeric dUTPase (all-alpha-NTP-PPase superfamily)